MRKVINIDIPNPCHEDWNKMTPEEKGRHCKVCQKTVFDFTSKTDEYIVKTFTENTNVCGRFKSTQLKRDLILSRKEKNNYLSFVASGLFAFLGLSNQNVYSQGEPKMAQVDSTKNYNKIIDKASSEAKSNFINGVVNGQDKLPLPGANIIIKSTTKGTVTDFDGNFSIEANENDILVISYLGFITKEITVTQDLSNVIVLELEEDISGEMIITVGGAFSCTTSYQLSPEEELERKRKFEFARINGTAFYKRKKKERKQNIKNGNIERSKTGKFLYKISNIFRSK